MVQDRLQALGELKDVVVGLAFAASSKVNPAMRRNERPWQLLNHLMDHEFLGRVLGVMDAREVYGAIEGLVTFDYHYWLQRGSLEVRPEPAAADQSISAMIRLALSERMACHNASPSGVEVSISIRNA